MAHRLSQALVFATLILLFIGGLVTSTDSGLAVPDWPLSYGSLFPPMVGGVRFEHTHRMVAAAVGLLTLILTLLIGFTEQRLLVRRLAIGCLAAVVLQGILGGLTVLYLLPAPLSIAHACLGPIFFSLVVSLAVLTNPAYRDGVSVTLPPISFQLLAMTTTFFIFLQIFLGAVVRHTQSGIEFHIASAFVVFFLTGLLVRKTLSNYNGVKSVLRLALFLGFLVIVEFFLGIVAFAFTHISGLSGSLGPVIFPTLHQTLGALILATSVLLTIRVFPLPFSRHFAKQSEAGGVEMKDILNFLEVTKPRLVALVLWSVTVGFLLASEGGINFFLLIKTLSGTLLAAGGAMALNQWLERDRDARMKRTETRPLPSGRVNPTQVLELGLFLSISGIFLSFFGVNFLAGVLTAFTFVSYLLVYTPLKTKTPLAILVGAVPGAFPPLIGWAAQQGSLTKEAWILFLIIFIWQLPHVLAISWIYREDYARAGFPMLSVTDVKGKGIGRLIVGGTLALLLTGLSPFLVGMNNFIYFLSALVLGIWLFISSIEALRDLDAGAQTYFRNTVIYLSLLLFLMLFTRRPL